MEKMSLFNKYSFESEFVEVNEQVLKVTVNQRINHSPY